MNHLKRVSPCILSVVLLIVLSGRSFAEETDTMIGHTVENGSQIIFAAEAAGGLERIDMDKQETADPKTIDKRAEATAGQEIGDTSDDTADDKTQQGNTEAEPDDGMEPDNNIDAETSDEHSEQGSADESDLDEKAPGDVTDGDMAEEGAAVELLNGETEEVLEQQMAFDESGLLVLDLTQGDIVLTQLGYLQGYGEPIAYEGSYRFAQTEKGVSGTVTVTGGSHTVTLTDVNINAEALSNRAAFLVHPEASVELILEGDNFMASGQNCAGIQLLTQDGRAAELRISGTGSLTAQGGNGGAGIGGGAVASGGVLTIVSGTVNAYGGEGGAGIGGGNNASSYKIYDCSGGIINIFGGTITAVGGNTGAGIGGGNHGDGGEITITGGRILLAQGGGGGAGIGSGLGSHISGDKGPGYYSGGIITMKGNFVIEKAIGGGNAAGIGGGMYGDSGDLSIRDGTILLAQGGDGDEGSYHHGSAGIGAGYQGHCKIFIKEVRIGAAMGAGSGAGIGSGAAANAGRRPNENILKESDVFICSSYIDLAKGGEYGGAGIGGGVSTDYVTVTLCGHVIVAEGGGNGAGVGSGGYNDYSYSCQTVAVVNINCGELIAAGGGEDADPIGNGGGNDGAKVNIDDDQTDLGGAGQLFAATAAEGYIGYYDGLAYSIQVDLPDGHITYSEDPEGPYTEKNPSYTEVGEYTVYYRAVVKHFNFRGSERVIIMGFGGEGGPEEGSNSQNRSGNSDRESPPGNGTDTGNADTAPTGPGEPEADADEVIEIPEADLQQQNPGSQGPAENGFISGLRLSGNSKGNPKTGVMAISCAAVIFILTALAAIALGVWNVKSGKSVRRD